MNIDFEVNIDKEKYYEIIAFTEYAYFTDKIQKFSGIFGGKRTLGEYLENFIKGKLAEEAFKEFLKKNFNIEVLTDLDLADFIISDYIPDFVAIALNNRYIPLNFWVEIKEVRRGQKWLLVSSGGMNKRKYDAYAAVWIGLPDEHLACLLSERTEIRNLMCESWKEFMGDLKKSTNKIKCKIVGFASWADIEQIRNKNKTTNKLLNKKFGKNGWHHFDGNTALFDPDDASWKGATVGENVGIALSRLHKSSINQWDTFIDLLKNNKRIASNIPKKYTTKKGKIRSHPIPGICKSFKESSSDYREIHQRCIEFQLKKIREKHGTIKRESSWFKQPLKK